MYETIGLDLCIGLGNYKVFMKTDLYELAPQKHAANNYPQVSYDAKSQRIHLFIHKIESIVVDSRLKRNRE